MRHQRGSAESSSGKKHRSIDSALTDLLLELRAFRALARAGVLSLDRVSRLRAVALALGDFGPVGAAPRVAAIKHGGSLALVDDGGTLTFDELEDNVNRLTNAFRSKGYGPDTRLAILCRNHRWPLIAAFAASRAGMTTIWLNTRFSAPQAAEVAAREGVDVLICDADLAEVADGIAAPQGKFRSAVDDPAFDELAAMVAGADPASPPPPERPGRLVQLTSGTTGLPKGAPRPDPRSLTIPGGLLERLPMRAREATVVAPPIFHGTGLVIALLSISLGSTLVLRRQFDPAQVLRDVADYRATTVCVVPVMLRRLVEVNDEEVARHDLSSLRIIFSAGSQLAPTVYQAATRRFGDVVHNLYGSTEVSITSIATAEDLRAEPNTVGRPALGVRIRILDDAGRELPAGQVGRIFVASTAPFEGYTGGGGKQIIDGFLSSGDLGHLDRSGRLYIDGRDDDMIISGGENVFPREVEDLLLTHNAIDDVAVIGVEDDEFGQRLRAFVVPVTNQSIDATAVQEFVKDNLARYKAPRDVIFVDELPRNAMGKVLKRELAALGTDAV
ncbi:putative fatty-acid-CoA synthetase FadD [Mycobacteroides stephanolepidis]|uniref:Long-chain-fatty-acid--CoA ligase FadD13 n=1 Tax=[Mycobacterium] stephanolepidis TaxID=1520670 RepID=A0A1Z4ETC9_9MYCO|nr:AMP-binding protein [[Mycobacterium] stephanolepidis]BAX96207.1 putative fatty-acid-CoA synthetase FadD [[Mycobacterium] stephanolepidis]